MALSPETRVDIQECLILTNNVSEAKKLLDRKGYNINRETVSRYYKEHEKIIKQAKRLYIENLAYSQAVVIGFEDHLLKRLAKLEFMLGEKLTKVKEEGESDEFDTQTLFAYLKIIAELKELLSLRKIQKVNEGKIIDTVISTLMSHRVVGPIIEANKESVLKLLKGKTK